ncbi:Aldo/keto reductase [Fomitiporia mediterranea MF3/22]|uniref:Aldo/keto reductase n=1 Tax=Fomitiporia mediterranea (strain MF3/22) TaxID=694068 RepID=UPI0004408B50|nr:Aldo/keto reductase [Fomitiporia mediterranea MF3/22]EJC99969.1 Aldo/keto reductase [Fomitiporia mediterranea MF3/22]
MATTKKIPTRRLGANGPSVSAVGLGTMGIGAFYGKTDEAAALKALAYAADRGMTFWDSADIYGPCELTLGKWFAETGRRSEIFLATKFGGWDPEGKFGKPGEPVSTPTYIKYALERSLKRLGTDYIDLYYQHRVDPNVPIEVVLETLREPVEKGTIRWIGLSECSVETLRRAKAVKGVGERVVAAQMEFSPFTLDIEKDGFAKAAKDLGVAVVAYSPLGRGLVSGKYRSRAAFEEGDFRLSQPRFSEENFPKNVVLADKFQAIADKYKSTASTVALAWILATSENYIPIPGCRTIERVEENAQGAELRLTPEDIATIHALSEAADVQGDRYSLAFAASVEGNCIPLEQWKGE